MADISFEVNEHIGNIAEYPTSWNKELNIVTWGTNAAKYDIRDWSPSHDRMTKGITLHEEEALRLMELLAEHFDMILLDKED